MHDLHTENVDRTRDRVHLRGKTVIGAVGDAQHPGGQRRIEGEYIRGIGQGRRLGCHEFTQPQVDIRQRQGLEGVFEECVHCR